ncbi:lysis system i-spanin subunit Rz [Citrobacter braakii]|uniref:lysis system i-spanin subunit Rz n=1 Tax=Citrobacter braakii TaxID=57706 RepID=UPI0019035990|nr:lysis system i-spanin subunit Rz [Citrobacter braakii]MBJ9548683.1 lysis protein [Citrobacter braakii]WFW19568.1 lysis protein [Citrobacter braakii]
MTLKAWLIIGLELLLSILIIYILFGQISKETRRADAAESLAKQRQETITDMTTRQRDVAALDAKYTKELADAKAENDALQRKLDNGGRVLVKGRCPMPASTQTSSASSVGNDATFELSDVAGRNVLGIRGGIKQDRAKIAALQQFITEQCSH